MGRRDGFSLAECRFLLQTARQRAVATGARAVEARWMAQGSGSRCTSSSAQILALGDAVANGAWGSQSEAASRIGSSGEKGGGRRCRLGAADGGWSTTHSGKCRQSAGEMGGGSAADGKGRKRWEKASHLCIKMHTVL